ncbi:hypothetical protein QOZ80_5AG0405740 [Eleusine coracana subsp. coracana]|nr:hypothetical protein QOZ80_5AG0405740 [Eleusine coracana subsp. coracana]
MNRRKLINLKWLVQKKARQAMLMKRRANLFKKASELSKLLDVPVAVVAFLPGEAVPTSWQPAAPEVAAILQCYANLPDSAKNKMDLAGCRRHRIEKLHRELDMMKLVNGACDEVIVVLADLFSRSYKILDDLSDDLSAAAMEVVQLRKKVVSNRMKSLMAVSQEAPMVPPPAMANPSLLLPATDPAAAAVSLVVWL